MRGTLPWYSTQCTPGIFSAALMSMDLMTACACGLQRNFTYSASAGLKSATNSGLPSASASASIFFTEWADDFELP